MSILLQEDFGAGIYRGRKAPGNSVFDAINALINDEGQLFRRGGSSFYSASNAGNTLIRVSALFYPAINANRVTAAGGGHFYALNGTTPVDLGSIATPGRPASVGGMAIFPIGAGGRVAYYAGSLKTATYGTGTISTTANSVTVTGAGTAWLANADAGMLLRHSLSGRTLVVKSVDSDTQLTLTTPWPTTNAGALYTLYPIIDSGLVLTIPLPTLSPATFVAAAGSGLPRLIITTGNRAYLSVPGDASLNAVTFSASSYHELPSNATIIGAEGVGDIVFLFTTGGVWEVTNLSLDLVDDFGNVQQQVAQISKDIILWSDLGIAGWAGRVIAPALDDVYLMGTGGAEPLTRSIRPLYRSYVAAGYLPGQATVHRGHYFLPILNGTTLVDELVCRLDRPYRTSGLYPWTRWAGHGASTGRATLAVSGSAPRLLGLNTQRVTDLTTALDATGSATEADGTTHTFTVDTSDFDTGPGIRPNTVEKIRIVYETAGGTPTFTVASAVGAEGASYTSAILKRGGGASDGTDYSAWRVGRKAERIRFRFQTASSLTSLILRRLELTIRQASQT